MRLPEGEKDLLAHVVGTGDTVEINLDFSLRTALGDGVRQTIRPFPNKLPIQDNSDSISQIEDCGSQHNQNECMLRSVVRCTVTSCILDT
jgi:hypothetical protein